MLKAGWGGESDKYKNSFPKSQKEEPALPDLQFYFKMPNRKTPHFLRASRRLSSSRCLTITLMI